MTDEEHAKYWMPAKKALGPYNDTGNAALARSQELAKLLGLAYPTNHYWEHIELTEEHKRKLEWIAGPHSHAICKMLEIQRGEKCLQTKNPK